MPFFTLSRWLGPSSRTFTPPSRRCRPMLEQMERREVPAFLAASLLALPEPHPVLLAAHHADTDRAAAMPFKVSKGGTITGTEHTALKAIVATFSGPPGSYKAKIVWGDHTTSIGKIAPQHGHAHRFTVTGTHRYGHAGTFQVSVTVTAPTHKAATVKTSAKIGHAITPTQPPVQPPVQPPIQPPIIPPLTVSAVSLASKAGDAFSGTVATFTPLAGTSASNYTASITWGDGHSSGGTITAAASGGLAVNGSNMYATGGGFPINVSIQGGGSHGSGQAEAVIQFPASLTAHGVGVSSVSGQSFTQTVAAAARRGDN
jgi:hypothetical protein